MNFTNSPFERMMRQRPGTDSDHPCISCRHRRECGYMMHQCRKKFRSVFGETVPPVSGTVGVCCRLDKTINRKGGRRCRMK